jgi:UDP-N-acetylmuramate-alanine ligase
MNLLKKIIFILTHPQVVLISGKGRFDVLETVNRVLEHYPEPKKALIFESGLSNSKETDKFRFYLRMSSSPILIATRTGEISLDKFSFKGERKESEEIEKLVQVLPKSGFLIFNFDDEALQPLTEKTTAGVLTYGFQERADITASDVNIGPKGTNFKISVEGNIIPFWLEGLFGKKHIYNVLAAVALAKIRNMNLVNISQIFQIER